MNENIYIYILHIYIYISITRTHTHNFTSRKTPLAGAADFLRDPCLSSYFFWGTNLSKLHHSHLDAPVKWG